MNKCHTPGGLTTASARKNQSRSQAAADDKKRRPCEACTLQNTKCDFGRPCSKSHAFSPSRSQVGRLQFADVFAIDNCSSRGSKCAYSKAKRPRRNTNPSPLSAPTSLPDSQNHAPLSHESIPINSYGGYPDDVQSFNFQYPPQDNPLSMPHMFDSSLSVPNSATFIGSPEAPSLSFSAATSDSTESSPWNGLDLMGLNNVPNANFDTSGVFHDPNAPSFTSVHKLQPLSSHFGFLDQPSQPDQLSLTSLHQRPASATIQRHPIQHHQRHRSSPSLDGSHSLLNHALLRAQGQQYPAITPSRLYMHRGSISASDSGTDYESPGRPGTASEYTDFPSPMSLVSSETGSATGIGRSVDDMSLHEPGVNSLMSMGSMMIPGIGMGTGLTPAVESPSRPSMHQRQSTFGDLRTFWNECMGGQNIQSNVGSNGNGNNENRNHSLTKMTSMPCLKTPLGDATPRASAADPLARLGQHRPQSGAGQTPRLMNQADTKSLEEYQSALNARPAPSLHLAPKMKAAAAKQEESDSNKTKNDSSFSVPFPPGSAQADAWRSLMSSTGSYVADSNGNRPNYKRLPSQTLGPENPKRPNRGDGDGDDNAVFTDDEEGDADSNHKEAQQEWHRRMSLPVMGRSGNGTARLYQPTPVPANRPNGVRMAD